MLLVIWFRLVDVALLVVIRVVGEVVVLLRVGALDEEPVVVVEDFVEDLGKDFVEVLVEDFVEVVA